MIYVYVFPVEGFDRHIADNELIKASSEGNGVERYSLAEFIESLNDDRINLDVNWLRAIDNNKGYYPVSFLHIDDLESAGFDVSQVSESDLITIADKMGDDFCDWMYWDSLSAIADIIGIPRQKD